MNTTSMIRAIRFAAETATVPQPDATGSRSVEDAIFTTEARQRLQRLIHTDGHMEAAREACTDEMMYQIREKNIDAAYAAVCLRERLPRLCPHRRDYVMEPDGTLRLVD
jgi:hypothetical protein